MSWYRTGSVTVTNGSPSVTGAGTAWFGVIVGDWAFRGPDGRVYEILSVASSTSITLAESYLGTTASGQPYAAYPTQALTRSLTERVSELIATFNGFLTTRLAGLFGAGSVSAPGVAREGDANTGIYWPADDVLGVTVGGVERARVSGSVVTLRATSAAGDGAGQGVSVNNSGETRQLNIGVNDANSTTWLQGWTPGSGASSIVLQPTAGNVGVGTATAIAGVKLNVAGGISSSAGLNVAGTGGFYNSASKFGVDNNGGQTRLYSSGPNSATRGSYDFRITDSVGSLDISAMVIDATGNVGVGYTGSPTLGAGFTNLHARGSTGAIVEVSNGTHSGGLDMSSGGVRVGSRTAIPFSLITDNAERMRISNTGDIGINCNPVSTVPLRIQQAGFADVGVEWQRLSATSGTFLSYNRTGSAYTALGFDALLLTFSLAGNERMRIDAAGNWILRNPPSTPPALTTNGDLTLNPTSNTNVRISYRGGDGVTRFGNITLAP